MAKTSSTANSAAVALKRVRSRGTAPLVALTAAAVLGGCATQAVLEKWEARAEIASIGLAVQTSRADEVEVRWRGLVADHSEVSGLLSVNPDLQGCSAVAVAVARRSGAPTRVLPDEQVFDTETVTTPDPVEVIWSAVDDPSCKLLLIFRRRAERNIIAVSASWQPHASQSVDAIGAPRQAGWLALIPASAAADTAGVILIVPLAVCLAMEGHCLDFLEGYQSQPREAAGAR